MQRLRATPAPADEAERKVRRDLISWKFHESTRYRYTVGHVSMGLFFAVEGEGDTWEEAFRHADDRRDHLVKLPRYFTQDSIERQVFKPQRCDREGGRLRIWASGKQLRALLSDARFYTDRNGPDACPAGLKASARAVIKALEAKGIAP